MDRLRSARHRLLPSLLRVVSAAAVICIVLLVVLDVQQFTGISAITPKAAPVRLTTDEASRRDSEHHPVGRLVISRRELRLFAAPWPFRDDEDRGGPAPPPCPILVVSRDGECCYAPAVLDVDGQCCRERVDECGVCVGASSTPSSTTNCDNGIQVRFSTTLHDHSSSNGVEDVPMLKAQYVSSLKDAMRRLGIVSEPHVNAEEAPPSTTTTSSAVVLTTTVIFADTTDPVVPVLFKAILKESPALVYRLMSALGRVSIELIDTTSPLRNAPYSYIPVGLFRDDEDNDVTEHSGLP